MGTGGAGRGDPQGRIEREEFARGRLVAGEPPVEPRAAATTVVARRNPRGSFDVLLLERPAASSFAAGAFVFPGGVVDEEDAEPFWADRLPEVSPEDAAGLVAGLRELFEETGLLLSDGPGPGPGRLARVRQRLLADDGSFRRVAEEFDLRFHGLHARYFARWITPAAFRRRYDTRFFLLVPDDPLPEVTVTREHDGALWASPRSALTRFRSGELPMLFPTWKTLERLAAFETVDAALADLGRAPVRPITPRLDIRGDRVRPLVPGDEGYDEAR